MTTGAAHKMEVGPGKQPKSANATGKAHQAGTTRSNASANCSTDVLSG